VLIPCYHEEAALPQLFEKLSTLRQELANHGTIQLLFIDDGSRDKTIELLQKYCSEHPNAKLICHQQNQGLAAALQTGLHHASTEIVASIDADCTYDPIQLANLLHLMTAEVDLVVASPYHPQGEVVGVSAQRLWISQTASRCYRSLLRHQLHTYTSCFRIYRRSTISQISVENQGFVGIPELLWKVELAGGRIVECPATLTVRTAGQSKMRIARVTLAHLKLLSRIAWQRLFGKANATSSDAPRFSSLSSSATSDVAESPVTTPHEHDHDCPSVTSTI
jgi:dolichol-phosphate mannosyltransferase